MAYDAPALPGSLGEIDVQSPAFARWRNEARARRDALRIFDRPQVLIGAGAVLAQTFVDGCLRHGRVVACLDNANAGTQMCGVPVIGDADLTATLDRHPGAIGILCCGSENAIAHFQRLWQGRPQPLIAWFEALAAAPEGVEGGHRVGFFPSFSGDAGIAAAWASARRVLHDSESLRTLDAVMLYRTTWDARHLAAVARPEKAIYFEPGVLPLHRHEVFIDGGAFDGDTARAFASRLNDRYDHIHAFELDPVNAEAFARRNTGMARVTLHPQGLWSQAAELAMEHRGDNGSRLSDNGTIKAQLVALDDADVGIPTLFKLDVEGAEVEAIRGAAGLIRAHKPKLAISAYHRHDDLVTIIDAVTAIRDDYSFSLRHYSPLIYDTVLYAV